MSWVCVSMEMYETENMVGCAVAEMACKAVVAPPTKTNSKRRTNKERLSNKYKHLTKQQEHAHALAKKHNNIIYYFFF